jgi:hypothetical protein
MATMRDVKLKVSMTELFIEIQSLITEREMIVSNNLAYGKEVALTNYTKLHTIKERLDVLLEKAREND